MILFFVIFRNYPEEAYVGFYEMMDRAILIRDPDLIKDMLTTNFDSFRNNRIYVSKRFDTLLSMTPFISDDNEWKDGRRAMLPMMTQSKVIGSLFKFIFRELNLSKYLNFFCFLDT